MGYPDDKLKARNSGSQTYVLHHHIILPHPLGGSPRWKRPGAGGDLVGLQWVSWL